jgi:hypothetical protein
LFAINRDYDAISRVDQILVGEKREQNLGFEVQEIYLPEYVKKG